VCHRLRPREVDSKYQHWQCQWHTAKLFSGRSKGPSVPREHIHFVTGKLAEHSLRATLARLAPQVQFDYSVDVLGISVAALLTPAWVAPRLSLPANATRVLLPGYCQGDLAPVAAAAGVLVDRGPKDLRDLPDYFAAESPTQRDYGAYDIQIVAEINHAPSLTRAELLAAAGALAADGADVIDVGCNPGESWSEVGQAVAALRDRGHRVSIDSMNPAEIERAVRAGAELVLSVNSTNRDRAADWGCEVVVVPDVPETLAGLDETVALLRGAGVPLRIDPILEPIGFGFARSLGRYLAVRQQYPQTEMMMGVGNLTELTDADSAAINTLLLGFCQELGVRSVLTTQVINWARSSVRECDLARRLAYHAVGHHTLPKHVEPRLVMLRDPKVHEHAAGELDRLAGEIKDPNYRVFAEGGLVHLVSARLHLAAADSFDLLKQLLATSPKNLDAEHAFYLGYELCKAATALTLSKDYRQDQALDWGFLTREERGHGGDPPL
jgi:dihydropteroate synthase